MKKFLGILLVGLTLNTISYAGTAAIPIPLNENGKERIKNCTKLLPEGHVYSIDIKVNIDKTNSSQFNNAMHELSISDETLQDIGKNRQEEIKPFIQCMIDDVL